MAAVADLLFLLASLPFIPLLSPTSHSHSMSSSSVVEEWGLDEDALIEKVQKQNNNNKI